MKKQDMLKKNKEFRYVCSRGKSVSSPYMILIFAKNKYGKKAGFSVSSKLGNAVTRNRTKRIMRAGLSQLFSLCSDNTSYLFIARAKLIGCSSTLACEQMHQLLLKAGKINEQ